MGKLTVHILEAQSLHDSQTFGKQDPYVLVEVRAHLCIAVRAAYDARRMTPTHQPSCGHVQLIPNVSVGSPKRRLSKGHARP